MLLPMLKIWHDSCSYMQVSVSESSWYYYLLWGYKMKCPKCKGRMYTEKYYDFVRAFDAWKCSACGEVIDPVILTNRSRNNSISMV